MRLVLFCCSSAVHAVVFWRGVDGGVEVDAGEGQGRELFIDINRTTCSSGLRNGLGGWSRIQSLG